jgi:hypothetical protein
LLVYFLADISTIYVQGFYWFTFPILPSAKYIKTHQKSQNSIFARAEQKRVVLLNRSVPIYVRVWVGVCGELSTLQVRQKAVSVCVASVAEPTVVISSARIGANS